MFKNGDVICFIGDSITASGLWESEVYQHLSKKAKIKCYNCGIAGATAALFSEYVHSYCLAKNPSHVVISFGYNDIYRTDYADNCTPEYLGDINSALNIYEEKLRCIINAINAFGSQAILTTPMPYDEISNSQAENLMHQAGLLECRKTILSLAREYNIKVIDFTDRISPFLTSHKIISPDRIHPTPLGYHVMAQTFLYETGEIDEFKADEPFVIEKWNQRRHSVEKTIKLIDFIDYVWLYEKSKRLNWNTYDRICECKKIFESLSDKQSFLALACSVYLKEANNRDTLVNELLKRTPAP